MQEHSQICLGRGAGRSAIKATMGALGAGVSLLLSLSCGYSARAANGFTHVSVCNCATTADFTAAAKTISASNHPSANFNTPVTATYTVVSATTTRTAYIQVSGELVYSLQGHSVTWVVSAAVPVDSTGASIASETESSQESFYGALDQTLFGANRGAPTTLNMPDDYAASFINSDDGETSPGIGQALILAGINPASIPINTVITVTFSDGTTAQFVKQSATATYQWLWNGVAHNKAGQRINRSGNVISNPNTAGVGGGSGSAPVWGNGSGSYWYFGGGSDCFFSGSVTLPDGSTFGSSGWGPC
jgi:hypothetical protein